MEWSLHAEWPYTSSFHFPAAAVCVSKHVQEVSHFCEVQEVKKVGGAAGAVWDCQVRVIKRPQESLIERRKQRGKKRQRGQRDGETEVGRGGGGQWGFWWGLSGEHMWVTAWINTLSLVCVCDLHAEQHFYCLCSQISPLHRLSHRTPEETCECMKTERHCPIAPVCEYGPSVTSFKWFGSLALIKLGRACCFHTRSPRLSLWLTSLPPWKQEINTSVARFLFENLKKPELLDEDEKDRLPKRAACRA